MSASIKDYIQPEHEAIRVGASRWFPNAIILRYLYEHVGIKNIRENRHKSRGNIIRIGKFCIGIALVMNVDCMLFVSCVLALGSQCGGSFWWNMGSTGSGYTITLWYIAKHHYWLEMCSWFLSSAQLYVVIK